MSVYIQEVLGLLKRNKKKLVLDKQRDHFEFGKLYQNSSLNNAGTYGPRMEPFVVKWGDLVCQATENLTRTQPGSGNLGFVPVYTVPEGSCAWDTVMDSIITQNALGDTITINNGNLVVEGDATVEGDLQVDQNANVNLQLTAGSANILDLTEDRIVIVGPNGELEDDANFTMDGVTFTALVNVQHGSITMAPVPPTTTTLNSNTVLNGPITDSQGNVGQLSQVLVGLGDGRVIWSDDDVVEALTYGSLWQGNVNNLKQELAIGTADQILISDGVTFAWQDNPSVKLPDVLCEVFRIPLWAPDNETIGCSLMIQDGDGLGTPATEVKNDGKLHQTGEVRLDTVTQDDTLTEVLVRDSGSANEVKFRDASTIIPQRGFDTLTMNANGGPAGKWTQTFLNAYIALDLSKQAFIDIKGMDNLTDGEHGVVVAENIQQGSVLPDDVIRFPNGWGTVGNLFDNTVTWTPGVDNGYPTSGLLFGESVKFSYINYDKPGGNNMLYWDACCKSNSGNTCPIANDGSIIIDEDVSVGGTVIANDDGFGSYGLTYTLVTQIPAGEGSITLDPANGNWVYTPEPNFFGVTSFQWSVNDGYCDSNIATQTITVRAVADPVIWTSTDPVTAGTYPNLTGGDTWTYSWTVADDDTPCNQLSFTTPNLPSWLTFTNNGDCTGTLSGVMPPSGGNFPVVLNVTDNDGSSDTQTFTIGGLGVTVNTYFQYWSDTSGSMVTTIRRTAKMASVPEVITRITDNNTGSGTTTIRFGNTVQANLNSGRVNAADGETAKSFYCIQVGMTVVGVGPAAARVPAGTTVVSYTDGAIPNQATAVLSNPHTLNQNDIVKFETTNAIMSADYANPANFRNLLQDFYATGGTEGAPDNNPDPATNGRDQYNTHVYWSHQNLERQIAFFSGGENGTPADGTNYNTIWPNADRVQLLCFGDESSSYNLAGNGTGTWGDRANSTVTAITDDVTTVKSFISNIVTASGNNSIYRGIFFPVDYNTGPNGVQLNPLLADNGLMATGGVTANGFGFPPAAAAYDINTETLYPESTGSPTYLTYNAEIADGNTNLYYYNIVKAALNNIGYTL